MWRLCGKEEIATIIILVAGRIHCNVYVVKSAARVLTSDADPSMNIDMGESPVINNS